MLPPGFKVILKSTGDTGTIVACDYLGGTRIYRVKRERDGEILLAASSDIEPANEAASTVE